VMSRKPGKQDPTKQSEARKKTRSKFKEAAAWATMIRRDPEKKAYYQQLAKQWGLTNDYIAAIRDYMLNPAIAMQYSAVVDDWHIEEPVNERTISVVTELRRADGQQSGICNRRVVPSGGRIDARSGPSEQHYHTYAQLWAVTNGQAYASPATTAKVAIGSTTSTIPAERTPP
jgi:hypothetical protein